MRTPALLPLLMGATSLFQGADGAAVARATNSGSTPGLPYDPNTTSYCTWWVDLETTTSCSGILLDNSITLAQFRRWNPSVPETCGTLPAGRSYCVEAMFEPVPTSSSTTSVSTRPPTTTVSTTTISTQPGNGITTPTPIQSGMVGNCNKFHFVAPGETCAVIAALYSVSTAQFVQWNPAAKSDCTGLWASTYACVGVIGGTPPPTTTATRTTTTTTTTTTTRPGNGITTPTPTHPGMVSNCNKFYFVRPGDTCDSVASRNGLASSGLIQQWNTAVDAGCRNLQADTYLCVGVVGATPTSSQPGNGVATPTPTQPGMVGNCKKFVKVNPGDTCDKIASASGISLDDFVRWNAGVGGRECRSLQAGVYACVGI